MTNCFILVILSFLVSVSHQACQTTVKEGTWPNFDSIHSDVTSLEECRERCHQDQHCQGYTFALGFNKIKTQCYLFKTLGEMKPCQNCESGINAEFRDKMSCDSQPEDILATKATMSAQECSNSCMETLGCTAFTWFSEQSTFPRFCFLYSKCDGERSCCIDNDYYDSYHSTCNTCISGRVNCIAAPQCFDYSVMDETTRNINFKAVHGEGDIDIHYCDGLGLKTQSPSWHGPGYYRMMPPAGVVMPEFSVDFNSCGTHSPMRFAGIHPQEKYVETEATFCAKYFEEDCYHTLNGTVTLCDGYYVYYLPDVTNCHQRFCAAMKPYYLEDEPADLL